MISRTHPLMRRYWQWTVAEGERMRMWPLEGFQPAVEDHTPMHTSAALTGLGVYTKKTKTKKKKKKEKTRRGMWSWGGAYDRISLVIYMYEISINKGKI